MALDLRLSRVHMGVAAMRQDCNYYQLDTMKLGRKNGKNKLNKSYYVITHAREKYKLCHKKTGTPERISSHRGGPTFKLQEWSEMGVEMEHGVSLWKIKKRW